MVSNEPPFDPSEPPPSADAVPVKRLVLTPASQIEIKPVTWTWHGRIPSGAITLVPGREGIGKSLFLAWLTAQITRGTLPGIHHGNPHTVIYAASEDSWSQTIAPRLLAAGADLTRVYRVEVERNGLLDSLTLPVDCAALATEVTRLGVVLLAADPLLSLISATINTHQDRDLRQALEPLARMAADTGCAVVGLAHFNKSASTDSLNLITGSRAFSAVSRAVIAVARDNRASDGSCVMSQEKSNLGRLDVPSLRYVIETVAIDTPHGPAEVGRLVFTGETDRTVSDILAENADNGDRRAERKQAAAWLADYLLSQGGSASRGDVMAAATAEGIAERTLQRACETAKVVQDRTGFPAVTIWRLTAGDTPSPDSPVAPQSRQSRQPLDAGATGDRWRDWDGHDIESHAASPNGAVVR